MRWNKIERELRLYRGKKKKRKLLKNAEVQKIEIKQKIEPKRIRLFYESFQWGKLRYETLLKYGRRCMCCRAIEGIFHVDHIKPVKKYWHLRLDPNNVQVLCSVCNHGKGSWDETDFRPEIKSNH